MTDRRDYHRWEPWMGAVVLAVLFFGSLALFASGHFLLGLVPAGIVFVAARSRRR